MLKHPRVNTLDLGIHCRYLNSMKTLTPPFRTLQIMNEVLLIALQQNTKALTEALSRFDYESFNRIPASGGWSASEIAEHLLLFDIRANNILDGRTIPVDRDPQEKVGAMQLRLTDTVNKIEAPEFLIPSGVPHDPKTIIDKILAERNKLDQHIQRDHINFLLPETKHRFFGEMTGTEWIQLIVLHCERHLKQLGTIK